MPALRPVVDEFATARERGQVLVLFAGGVLTLLIVAALAFDVGMMLLERRDQQNAADAAALAGARYVFEPDCVAPTWTCTEARAAAISVALANGYDDADPSESVAIQIPADNGRYIGLPNFIEVDINAERPSIFGGVIGQGVWPVSVFAVATNDQDLSFPFSMMALNKTACKAMQVSGTGEVTAYGNIQSNSNGSDCVGDPIGFSRTGGGTIDIIADDATCRSAGEIQDQGSGEMTCTPAENSFALPDPLAGLEDPAKPPLAPAMTFVGPGLQTSLPNDHFPKDCPGDTTRAPSETNPQQCKLAETGAYQNKAWILYPGLYPAGLEVTGGTTAYLMPGVYWIGGGGIRVATGGSIISIEQVSNATVALPTHATWNTWDSGVLIFNSRLGPSAGGNINFNGDGARLLLKPLSLTVDDTDPYCVLYCQFNDLVLYQDRTLSTTVTLNGSASEAEVAGIIYIPGGLLTLNGNSGSLTVDQVIADQFLINGNNGNILVLKRYGIDALIVAAGLVD
ncbi:MAG TPA: pilus assembly protein TadG-related protein [Candidatus Limnocylindrales bacterium]|nr:pilus assembly protein TadG-related protein [Candidatus Limnocylindrales bacterium]